MNIAPNNTVPNLFILIFPWGSGPLRRLDLPIRSARETLRPFQLRILFHQLLQAEARELYRNLGFFAFPFALVDRAFPILRMAHSPPWPEAALARRLLNRRCFGQRKFLSPAGKELRNVFDRVVRARRSCRLRWPRGVPAIVATPHRALILIFIRIMSSACVGAGAPARSAERTSAPSPRPQLLDQVHRNFFEEPRGPT